MIILDHTLSFINEEFRDDFIEIMDDAKSYSLLTSSCIIYVAFRNKLINSRHNRKAFGIMSKVQNEIYSISQYNTGFEEMVKTYLHELRHVWQDITKFKSNAAGLAWKDRPEEIDAERWSNEYFDKFLKGDKRLKRETTRLRLVQ